MTNDLYLFIVSMIRKTKWINNGIAHVNSELEQKEGGVAASTSETSFRIRV
jgi:hypothetical protein